MIFVLLEQLLEFSEEIRSASTSKKKIVDVEINNREKQILVDNINNKRKQIVVDEAKT